MVFSDAEVLIYTTPLDFYGTDLVGAGIAIAIDILAAKKLKIIIKDGKVVGINQES